MKHTRAYIVLFVCLFFCCEKMTAQNQDYKIESYKLSCDDILMKNYTGILDTSTFTYGEEIEIFYKNIKGFTLQDGLSFPNMNIFVTTKMGDTVMSQKDLFKDITKGYTLKDLNLRSTLTFAAPMMPNNAYTMHVHISDKKSDAFYNMKKDFSLVESSYFKTKKDGLTYSVLYLYSLTRNLAIVNARIKPNEEVFILLENLTGYTVDENGKVDLEGSISLTDSFGNIIKKTENLFKEPVNAKDLKEQLFASIEITEGEINNPVTCTLKIRDKKSEYTLETSIDLIVE